MKRTFREYIVFLRENKFNKEADFYETEVTKVLMNMGFSLEAIMVMSTKDVVSNLLSYYNLLCKLMQTVNTQKWDVEINGI